jgi:glycosyltransferase involved in cell wall biosynthesis
MKADKISFIIPHKGRTEMLVETVKSIREQGRGSDQIEIILVTQNQDLETQASDLPKIANLNIILSPMTDTISRMRNTGVQHSKGKYLAFLDADVYLAKNWLDQVQSLLQSTDYILVSAIQNNSHNAPPLERIRTALANSGRDSEVKFLPGRNLFLRRSDFERVGGFPEHLVTCEDYYFTNKISHLGKMFYTSHTSYIHLGEDKNFGDMFRKEVWRGQSNLQSIRGRQLSIAEVPSFVMPPAFTTMLLLMLFFLVTSNPTPAIFTLLLSCLMLIIYISRLHRLVDGEVSLLNQAKFYCYYFPARTIGTFVGLFKVLESKY